MTKKERIGALLVDISEGIFGKDMECKLAMLAALAGESIILLGPPGVAKSMVARRMKRAFENANSFEYLMSRFSTPDEIFGPVSIHRLKTDDVYERTVDGFLPTADVVFLDEIWKAGPAIQNTLLTVLNEHLFRNGKQEIHLPLKLLVAASNELPALGEGLEALWDRFLVRYVSQPISDENVFHQMLKSPLLTEDGEEQSVLNAITPQEYSTWRSQMQKITISEDVLRAISHIRKHLGAVECEGSTVRRNVYVSDRRWRHIINLLQASSFIHGCTQIRLSDMLILSHCLWNSPDELKDIRKHVIEAIFSGFAAEIEKLRTKAKADLKKANAQKALRAALEKMDENDPRAIDNDLLIVDDFFFEIENIGIGYTYIFMSDFVNMKIRNPREHSAHQGIMYQDPRNPKRTIVSTLTGASVENELKIPPKNVMLYRDFENLYIDGVRYSLRRCKPGEGRTLRSELADEDKTNALISDLEYPEKLEDISARIRQLKRELKENIFNCKEDLKAMEKYATELSQQIAEIRYDVSKLNV